MNKLLELTIVSSAFDLHKVSFWGKRGRRRISRSLNVCTQHLHADGCARGPPAVHVLDVPDSLIYECALCTHAHYEMYCASLCHKNCSVEIIKYKKSCRLKSGLSDLRYET